MSRLRIIYLLSMTIILVACGGEQAPDVDNNPFKIQKKAFNGIGQFTYPQPLQMFNGNLLLTLEVNDPEGLNAVFVQFNGAEEALHLCSSSTECGVVFTDTVTGVNPRNFGIEPGVIDLELWIEDGDNNLQLIDQLQIEWQPTNIEGIEVVRDQVGEEIAIDWQINPQLLRYNVYLAAETAVNLDNFQQLPQGQALLALKQGPVTFSGLNSDTTYFVLVTGIDDSGESAFSVEFEVAPYSAPNTVPIANDDAFSTAFNTSININVLSNDSDIDGDNLLLQEVNGGIGSVVIEADSTITYTPQTDFVGDDTFSYIINDSHGGSSMAQVVVSVAAPENNTPIANDDAFSTAFNTSININVLANDSDIDGDNLLLQEVNGGIGSVVIEADSTITYTPQTDFVGDDTFSYIINDSHGGSSMAQVVVSVAAPENNTPVANDDAFSTAFNTSININVLANDSDIDGDNLLLQEVNGGIGSVVIQADSTITYTPQTDFVGDDTFSYIINDSHGGSSMAQVVVSVAAPENNTPVANDDAFSTAFNTSININVLANDSDIDGDNLLLQEVNGGIGSVVIEADSTITYTPQTDFVGDDTFSYIINDSHGGSSMAQVVVSVAAPENNTPVANDDAFSTAFNTSININVLANDSDIDGDNLLLQEVNGGIGSVVIQADSTITYTPQTDFVGDDTFSYIINDSHGGSSMAQVVVSVAAPENNTPVANDDAFSTAFNTSININVLANDSDIDGDNLLLQEVNGGIGSVVIQADSTITYTPQTDFVGDDTFSYIINDSHGGSSMAQVVVSVAAPVNNAPVANDDAFSTAFNTSININVLANDSDIDGDNLLLQEVNGGIGSVVIQTDNTITYTPQTDFVGDDTFSYIINDSHGGSSMAQVVVSVEASLNNTPVANDDAFSTAFNTSININVLANDFDEDGDDLLLQEVNGGIGSVVIQADSTITYTPQTDFVGDDTFSYIINDSHGGSSMAQVVVSVAAPVNNAPVANDDAFSTAFNTSININVLANDSDIDGDNLLLQEVNGGIGSVVIQTDNTITYTPQTDFVGDDTFSYIINDSHGGSSMAQVVVSVEASLNNTPVANDDAFSTAFNTSININVLANDFDEDGDDLLLQEVNGGIGSVVIEADNTITYTPQTEFFGDDTFTYIVNDPNGDWSMAQVVISVAAPNNPPLAQNDYYYMYSNSLLTVGFDEGLLINDLDPDGNPSEFVIALISEPNFGQITLQQDGSFEYIPDTDFIGGEFINYSITDAYGATSQAQIIIDVQYDEVDFIGYSISATGELLYVGIGESSIESGTGTGHYRIGNCVVDTDTVCSVTGTYMRDINYNHIYSNSGRYALIQKYSGSGLSPVIARLESPDSNILNFIDTGDSVFELSLFPDEGGMISGKLPDIPFADSIGIKTFITSQKSCTGLPAASNCDIANVGMVANSSLTAPIERIEFKVPVQKLMNDRLNMQPSAQNDNVQIVANDTFLLASPGVLENDSDPDIYIGGDALIIRNSFEPELTQIVGLGVDEYRQMALIYPSNETDIYLFDRLSELNTHFAIPGGAAENLDLEITPEAMQLGVNQIPQGSMLLINGQSDTVQLYAMDIESGILLGSLEVTIAGGAVVAGTYNIVSKSIFLLQNNQANNGSGSLVAEIDALTGTLINTFETNVEPALFELAFSGIASNAATGNLYLVSSVESSIAEFSPSGSLIRRLEIPSQITNVSSIAINRQGDRVWLSTLSGEAFELEFSNQGVLPQLIAELAVAPLHGNVELSPDGAMIFVPEKDFVGQDSFIYRLIDQRGGQSLATVTVEVAPSDSVDVP